MRSAILAVLDFCKSTQICLTLKLNSRQEKNAWIDQCLGWAQPLSVHYLTIEHQSFVYIFQRDYSQCLLLYCHWWHEWFSTGWVCLYTPIYTRTSSMPSSMPSPRIPSTCNSMGSNSKHQNFQTTIVELRTLDDQARSTILYVLSTGRLGVCYLHISTNPGLDQRNQRCLLSFSISNPEKLCQLFI